MEGKSLDRGTWESNVTQNQKEVKSIGKCYSWLKTACSPPFLLKSVYLLSQPARLQTTTLRYALDYRSSRVWVLRAALRREK